MGSVLSPPTGRPSLRPADDVLPWNHRVRGSDTPLHVGDMSGAVVERDARDGDAAIADRPKYQADTVQRFQSSGATSRHPAVTVGDQLVPLERDRFDAAGRTDQRHRRHAEPKHDPAVLRARIAPGNSREILVVWLGPGVDQSGPRHLVEEEILVRHGKARPLDFANLLDFSG